MNNVLSVIVPVYNDAANIGRCLSSLINQTFKKMEIIVVNDKAPFKLESTTVASISSFQSLCISAAYQWLDITLLDKLVDLQKSIQRAGYSIKIDYKELMRSGKEMLLDHFKKRIEKTI